MLGNKGHQCPLWRQGAAAVLKHLQKPAFVCNLWYLSPPACWESQMLAKSVENMEVWWQVFWEGIQRIHRLPRFPVDQQQQQKRVNYHQLGSMMNFLTSNFGRSEHFLILFRGHAKNENVRFGQSKTADVMQILHVVTSWNVCHSSS